MSINARAGLKQSRRLVADDPVADTSPHPRFLHLSFAAFNRTFALDLELVPNLLPADFRVDTYGDGESAPTSSTPAVIEHCHYHGHIAGEPGSRARISTCGGATRGWIASDRDDELYIVETVADDNAVVAFKASDVVDEAERPGARHIGIGGHTHGHGGAHGAHGSCEMRHVPFADTRPTNPDAHHAALRRRRRMQSGHPVKIVELWLILDKSYSDAYGAGAIAAAQSTVADMYVFYQKIKGMNSGNPDIRISLKGATVLATSAQQNAVMGVSASTDIGQYLDRTQRWASGDWAGRVGGADAAHLLTKLDMSGGTAGVAYVGTMCRQHAVGVNEDGRFSYFTSETITHEMGHNFGASHDSSGNNCDPRGDIMAAISTLTGVADPNLKWSTCSENYIVAKIQALQGLSYNCLDDGGDAGPPPTRRPTPRPPTHQPTRRPTRRPTTFPTSPPQVAPTRRPTPRPPTRAPITRAPTPTRNPTRFPALAPRQCSRGQCCDRASGRFKPAGTACRAATHQCDLVDMCNGASANCPSDMVKPDFTACTESGAKGHCYGGSCVGYDGQCTAAFGQLGNGFGTEWVPCTDPYTGGSYVKCGPLSCKPRGAGDDQCLTMAGEGSVRQQWATGTRCGAGPRQVCSGGACVDLSGGGGGEPGGPGGPGGGDECDPATTCSGHGRCAQSALNGAALCHCDPGFKGSDCGDRYTGSRDCAALRRRPFVANDLCGPCADTYSHSLGPAHALSGGNDACDLSAPAPRGVVASTSYWLVADDAGAAADGDPFSHWTPPFDAEAAANGDEVGSTGYKARPFLTIEACEPFTLTHYELMSSNEAPDQDPAQWTVEVSTQAGGHCGSQTWSGGAAACAPWDEVERWHVVDTREGERFGSRHERRVFALNLAKPASPEANAALREGVRRVRFTFGAVRQMVHASQLQLAEARVLGPAAEAGPGGVGEGVGVGKNACAAHGGWGTEAIVGFAVAVALAVALAAWGVATWRREKSERGLRRRYSTRLGGGRSGGGRSVGSAPPSPFHAAGSMCEPPPIVGVTTSFSSARAFWTAGAHAGDGKAQTGGPKKPKVTGGFLAGLFAGKAKAKVKSKARRQPKPKLRKANLAQQQQRQQPAVSPANATAARSTSGRGYGCYGASRGAGASNKQATGGGVPPADWFSSQSTRTPPRKNRQNQPALPTTRVLATSTAPALARPPPQRSQHQRKPSLPSGWEAVKGDDGDTYYWNRDSGDTTWEKPKPAVPRRPWERPR